VIQQIDELMVADPAFPGRVSVDRGQTGQVRLIEQILRLAVVVSINRPHEHSAQIPLPVGVPHAV